MKTYIVTGGARGIGRAIIDDLARDHQVVCAWHTTEPVGLTEHVASVRADLRDETAGAAIVEVALARFGRIDGIVNNAGLMHPTPKEGFPAQDALDQMTVNVVAPAALLSAALPHLERGSAIVNISSVNAELPPKGAAMYGASKAALEVWTLAMAKELGPDGIRVNAISPGAIETPDAPRPPELVAAFEELTALGHLGTPADIAGAVRFLLGDEARFITGQVLRVCGGYRL